MKRELIFSALCVGCLAPLSSAEAAKGDRRPNVIFILADDLGYADLGCYGQELFQTPNIDKMAALGVQFTQCYAGTTVSAPSRTSLVTGKHTGNTYIRGNKSVKNPDGKIYDTTLLSEEYTLGEMFKDQGYKTACIGKWGMGGPNTEGSPNAQGFDYYYGYLGQGYAHSYFPKFLHENNTEVELDGTQYSHDLVEDKAIEYITENRNEPFFIYLTFTLPHAELLLPEEYMAKYNEAFPETPFIRTKGSYSTQMTPHAAFAAMVERLDLSVGRINELLKDLGIAEDTIVIFSSDNGAHREGGADPEFFNSTGVYRGIKRDLYEGGIRVPFIAACPTKIPAGQVTDIPIAFWDMMPTFADLIGAKPQKQSDGISVLPLFYGEKAPKRDYLYWEFHEQGGKQAVRKGDWKLIRLQASNAEKSYYELYNIVEDPSEANNVAEANPKMVAKLAKLIDEAHSPSEMFPLLPSEK